MCGQGGQQLELEFDWKTRNRNHRKLKHHDEWVKKKSFKTHRLHTGKVGLIITQDWGMIPAEFGYYANWKTPKRQEERSRYSFNVRCEGGMHVNSDNDPEFIPHDGWDIFKNPVVSNDIFIRRCVVPFSYFIEGPKSPKHKFVIQRKDGEDIYVGGNYVIREDKETGLLSSGFTLYTLPYSTITWAIGHERSPLEIPEDRLEEWLDPELTQEEIESFFEIADGSKYQAYRAHDFIMKKKDLPEWSDDDDQWIKPQSEIIEVA